MSKEFDLVVMGASGFTGQHVVEEVAQSLNSSELYKNDNFKWAIAGRNKAKLEQTLKEAERATGLALSHIEIIMADVTDYPSVLAMCRRTRLVISVVGPYRFYGEPIVKACVEGEANYVDISGEPQFLENMQLKYHEKAKEKKIFIVGSAGYDSIPSDLGTSWTKKMFNGDLAGVEIVTTTRIKSRFKIHYTTWQSAIYGLAYAHELGPLRRKLFKDVLPFTRKKPVHSLPARSVITKFEDTGSGYCVPFLGPENFEPFTSAVHRSEVFKFLNNREKPIQCATYFKMGSLFLVMSTIFLASLIGLLAKTKFGLRLMERFPGFFSFGYVSHEGPSRADMAATSFSTYIIGHGWDEKYVDPDREHSDPPQKKIITRVSGPDPGYIATSSFVVHSGISLLKERQNLPGEGGVLTPGAAFCNTNLIQSLAKRGIKFEIIQTFTK